MRNKFIVIYLTLLILSSCVGTGSKGVFGTGVSVALDPRSLGTQIDDSIMQKNLVTRLTLMDKNHWDDMFNKQYTSWTADKPVETIDASFDVSTLSDS